MRNVEKEFGTVARVAGPRRGAGRGGRLPGGAEPAEPRCVDGAASGAAGDRLVGAPAADAFARAGRRPTDTVSVQHGFAAIAETGTLMLPSAPERPTTLNLLADTAIVVLRASPPGRRL